MMLLFFYGHEQEIKVKTITLTLTLSDMALTGYAPSWRGGLARMLDFLPWGSELILS